MKECGHKDKKDCAWKNRKHHKNYPNDERYGACFKKECRGLMNKGAYLGEQQDSQQNWNIHHKNSNPKDNRCENLTATHPECNQELG